MLDLVVTRQGLPLVEKTVVTGDEHVRAVQGVADLADEGVQVLDGFAAGVEDAAFTRGFVTNGVDVVLVEVDDAVRLDGLAAFLAAHGEQVIGAHGEAAHAPPG